MSEELKEIVKKHVEAIRKTSLFHGLPMADLIKFLVNCKHNDLKIGDTIFEEGEPSTDMVIVLNGQVEIYKDEAKVCTLDPPTLVGEIGLFTESPRNATVLAVEDSISLTITQDDINSFFQREQRLSQKIYRNIILSLRNKINNDNQQIMSLQEELREKDEKINKLNASPTKEMSVEDIELPSEDIEFSSEEIEDVPPEDDAKARSDRTSIRVSISNQKYCYLKIGKSTVHVKDLSLGGISIDLDSVKEADKEDWDEGKSVRGEMYLQNEDSFPFSGTIRKIFSQSCGIQFTKLSLTQENAIIKTVNDLQRLGQVI